MYMFFPNKFTQTLPNRGWKIRFHFHWWLSGFPAASSCSGGSAGSASPHWPWGIAPKLKFLWMEEILHQSIGGVSYLWGFNHPRWCRISSIHSSTGKWWLVNIRDWILEYPVFRRIQMGLNLFKDVVIASMKRYCLTGHNWFWPNLCTLQRCNVKYRKYNDDPLDLKVITTFSD